MNKKLLLIPIAAMLLISFVAADMVVTYNFKDEKGDYTNNVNGLVYSCLDSDCASVKLPEWVKVNSNSYGNNYDIEITYPQNQDTINGYAYYFSKEGYLPMVSKVTAFGNGERTKEIQFQKVAICRAQIDDFSMINSVEPNKPLVINVKASLDANVKSAFTFSQLPPKFVPVQLKEDFYSVQTNIILEITDANGNVVYTDNKLTNILADDNIDVNFVWTPTIAGNYKARITTSVPDNQCESTQEQFVQKQFTVIQSSTEDMCYTLINNLVSDKIEGKVGEKVIFTANKISNRQLNNVLIPVETDMALTITKNGNLVDGQFKHLAANSDNYNPQDFSFEWTPSQEGLQTISVKGIANDPRCIGLRNIPETSEMTLYVKPFDTTGNHEPVIQDLNDKEVNENEQLTFILNAIDVDNDELVYSVNNLPTGASFNIENKEFSWLTSYDTVEHELTLRQVVLGLIGINDLSKTFEIEFKVSDGKTSVTKTVKIKVNDVNRNPILNVNDVTVNEGDLVNLNPTATDEDNDKISFSYSSLLNSNGEWQTKEGDSGIYNVEVTARDAFGGEDSKTITIKVNKVTDGNVAPELLVDDKEIVEGDLLEFTLGVNDPDNTQFLFDHEGLPAGAKLNFMNGLFSWQTEKGDAGLYYVTFKVSDGSLIDSKTIRILVKEKGQEISLQKIPSHRFIVESLQIFGSDEIKPGEDLVVYASVRNQNSVNQKLRLRIMIPELGIVQDEYFNLGKSSGKSRIITIPIPEDSYKGNYAVIAEAESDSWDDTKITVFDVV
ncbi:MAG TPA: Ig-like domain-containing protein [Candidatus Nanoarchaeia archaeon]|nr:Ig-like domain-containing protein [Candidatus Nanoarchaeia archaeon]